MNADSYPPINVLSVFRGLPNKQLRYPITPYRFEKKNGQTFRIREIRQFHSERHGKGRHFHFVVVSDNDTVSHILFDTNTFTWRLLDQNGDGRAIANG